LKLADAVMNRFFLAGNLADNNEEVVRIAGLLRGTESAAQTVSVRSCSPISKFSRKLTRKIQYGLSSVSIMASVGDIYLNFGLWAVAILPAWLIVKEIGTVLGDKKLDRETRGLREASDGE